MEKLPVKKAFGDRVVKFGKVRAHRVRLFHKIHEGIDRRVRDNHHEVGERTMPGIPVKLSNVPQLNYSDPPDVGQHNHEVFGGLLGLSDAEIKILMEQKVIY